MYRQRRWIIPVMALTSALIACSIFSGDASEQNEKGEPDDEASESTLIYTGLGLESLESYANTFEVTFTPDYDGGIPWTY